MESHISEYIWKYMCLLHGSTATVYDRCTRGHKPFRVWTCCILLYREAEPWWRRQGSTGEAAECLQAADFFMEVERKFHRQQQQSCKFLLSVAQHWPDPSRQPAPCVKRWCLWHSWLFWTASGEDVTQAETCHLNHTRHVTGIWWQPQASAKETKHKRDEVGCLLGSGLFKGQWQSQE